MYKNILLIDDDPDDQEIFLSALANVPGSIQCTTLQSGLDALRDLESKKIQPECIFLDLNMPVMTGQKFLAEIKKNRELSSIPVVIFSTTSHLRTIEHTRELGAHDFITKPDKFDDLVRVLKKFFAG